MKLCEKVEDHLVNSGSGTKQSGIMSKQSSMAAITIEKSYTGVPDSRETSGKNSKDYEQNAFALTIGPP